MINISKLDKEYVVSLLFGSIALILSLIISLVSGNLGISLLINTLIFTIVFSIIGYASIFIIKKYVPEVYEIFDSNYVNMNEDNDINAENNDNESAAVPEEGTQAEAGDADVINNDVSNNIEDNDDLYTEAPSGNIDIHESDTHLQEIENENNKLDFSDNKNQNFKYEPKIAAQAIRTMMKRDDN